MRLLYAVIHRHTNESALRRIAERTHPGFLA